MGKVRKSGGVQVMVTCNNIQMLTTTTTDVSRADKMGKPYHASATNDARQHQVNSQPTIRLTKQITESTRLVSYNIWNMERYAHTCQKTVPCKRSLFNAQCSCEETRTKKAQKKRGEPRGGDKGNSRGLSVIRTEKA